LKHHHFAINALKYENDLGIFGKKNACSFATALNFISTTLGGANAG